RAENYWKARDIADKMTYFELSTHADFMDQFVSACFLPHTDAEEFPSVADAAQ
ncbi:MAG: ASKHA domain-containing protein, partial [Planctomycetota bacterium]